MDDLEKIKQWLLSYPQWEEGGLLYIDYADAIPGNCGLYPTGLEEVSRKRSITGVLTVKNRYRFALYRVTKGQSHSQEAAQWLMDFQNWVQRQSAAGLAPVFGDDPRQEHICAEQGKLQAANMTGTGKYVVMLTAEFVKIYDEE